MKVLLAASELTPIAKVGGLGDVVGALPKTLKKLGVEVAVIIPYYAPLFDIELKTKQLKTNLPVKFEGEEYHINLFKTSLPGTTIPVYLVENDKYLSCGGIYLSKSAFCDSVSEANRFKFFSHAVNEIIENKLIEVDVLHCQDWHTGELVSIAKKPTLFTIHNIANQGKVGRGTNYMSLGIEYATVINTVSPTYAKEILTKEFGEKQEKLLQKRENDLFGILNGIDYQAFNPKTDKDIYKNYDVKSFENKEYNKRFLLKKLKLDPSDNSPLLGLVSRLTEQKAIDVVGKTLERLIKSYDFRFVALGSGSKKYEKILLDLQKKYPKKISAQIKFDAALAQKIYAASDIFLMPSRFEPCGLGQMVAMRYGTIPVATKTGGLADSITDGKTGFLCHEARVSSFAQALESALNAYENEKAWGDMIIRAMNKDFSWEKSAKEYLKLYKLAKKKYFQNK